MKGQCAGVAQSMHLEIAPKLRTSCNFGAKQQLNAVLQDGQKGCQKHSTGVSRVPVSQILIKTCYAAVATGK